uniref:protein-serine/threonine phosphatase n=1 Tax=Kalanchoe fedtschenkoi TaxID=63787 RepID=A0A7N0VH79_KALFE
MGTCLSSDSRDPLPNSPPGSVGIKKKKNARKKMGSRNSSFEYRREDLLHRIPGRLFLNGSSDVACLFTQQGKKGTNQDAMIVWENFASRSDAVFCGVFDGHGPYGHLVAKRVRDSLPLKLSSHWDTSVNGGELLKEFSLNTNGSMNSEDASSIVNTLSVEEEETKNAEIFQAFKESFLKAFRVMDRELRLHTGIDCFCSGTTAVTLIKQGRNLIIGNVGDSRAVLGTRDNDGSLIAVQLTVDLKPNLPAEEARIRKCKGRVFSLHDEPDVARVWLPNTDAPGLAMARAFGDFCLKDFGLISVPEISSRTLTEKDEFVVLASDGIWDVLSNEEVVNVVALAPSRSTAARALVETAVRAWRSKYPISKVDDCAVVCLFLDANSNDVMSSASSNTKSKEQPNSLDQADSAAEKDLLFQQPTGLDRSGTVHSGKDNETPTEENAEDFSDQIDQNPSDSEIDWLALEGVSRVNTLLNLPRFVPGDADRKALEAKQTPNER